MGLISTIHHIEFIVSNALQSAYWYCSSFGFEKFAERRTKESTSIALRNGTARVIITSYNCQNIYTEQLKKHGDFIKDVAFRVDFLNQVLQNLMENDIKVIQQGEINTKEGLVRTATLLAEGSDVTHTLYELNDFKGEFLPHFTPTANFQLFDRLEKVPAILMDHVVQNYPVGEMEAAADWYYKTMKLKRFWSVDDKVATSQYSAMSAWLLVNEDHTVQMTLAEGVKGRKGKSQIEEFIAFHGGSGVQHFALLVDDIISAVQLMKTRSVDFLNIPDEYYNILEERLSKTNLHVKEDLKMIRKLNILMDFDENGYLLQIFTKPVQDRPTLFIEIIQRANFKGFGAGNFKALFDAVEREQEKRGTLF
uniref:VOC domain-containing protein n=1 Tax=Caenorhabditis japonica TaxID=281687 RepID=A0A8R1HT35_CAEJA